MRLLQSWDDAVAARLFTPNVAQDEPMAERRRKAELIRQRIGAFREDEARPAEFDSPAHCRWWLRGDRGVVQARSCSRLNSTPASSQSPSPCRRPRTRHSAGH